MMLGLNSETAAPTPKWHSVLNPIQNWGKKPIDLKTPNKNDPRIIWNFTGKK